MVRTFKPDPGSAQLIFRRVDFLPVAVAQNRLELCNLMFNNALVRCDNDQLRRRDHVSFEVVVRDTIELAAAALCVPFRGDYAQTYSVSSWLEAAGVLLLRQAPR